MAVIYDDLKSDYDGSLFVNCRSIINPVTLMKDLPKQGSDMKLGELVKVLEFVESCALSQVIHFDNTVPEDTLEKAYSAVETIKSRVGSSRLQIMPSGPKDDVEFLSLALNAISDAHSQFVRLIQDRSGSLVRRSLSIEGGLPDDEVQAIVQIIKQRSQIGAEEQQDELSPSVLTTKLRGRKLLAGLVHSYNSETFNTVCPFIVNLPSVKQQGEVLSAMINTFRAHLLNRWAEARSSAYQPPDNVGWYISEHCGRMAWAELRKRKLPELQIPSSSREGFVGVPQIPPIGLWALMQTKGNEDPLSILENAVNLVRTGPGKSFLKVLWDTSVAGQEQFHEFEDLTHEASSAYYRGEEPAVQQSPGKWLSLVSLPVESIKTYLSNGKESMTGEAWVTGTTTVIGISMAIFELWKRVRAKSRRRGFISFYCRLASGVKKADRTAINSKVKQIFKRQLDWSVK